ncbi:hypothetical protein ACIRL2_46150 [Embleya sp. NPDC127516]|uniref:hypothetical protein n=1 Tax=Embleya sp. NPDC127516 TaxID=3363990 RepID=UPI00381FC0A5
MTASTTTPASVRRWQPTGRDRELLAWIGRWRCITSAQAAAEFEQRGTPLGLRKAQRRLRAARDLGLVAWQPPLQAHQFAAHWLTRKGMREVDLRGSAAAPSPASLQHDLAVVDVALHITRTRPTLDLASERELRAHHRARPDQEPAGAVRVFANVHATRPRLVVADILTTAPGRSPLAHLVRFDRPTARTGTEMLALTTADHLAGAVYWCPPDLETKTRDLAYATNHRAHVLGRNDGHPIVVRALPPSPHPS